MAGSSPLLSASNEAKTTFTTLVEAINLKRAENIVADITLKVAGSRTAAQSPYEITLIASTEGNALRSALFAVSQPGAVQVNAREMSEKMWEVRSYRPVRKGALIRSSQPLPEETGQGLGTQSAMPSSPHSALLMPWRSLRCSFGGGHTLSSEVIRFACAAVFAPWFMPSGHGGVDYALAIFFCC